jgi:ABC-2 type transport system ATP-binding protein
MKEAETLCEQVAIIKDGTMKIQGRPKDLKRELRLGDTILISFRGSASLGPFETLKGIYDLQLSDFSCRIVVDDHRERLPQILDFFTGKNLIIYDLRIQESDLEDVFIAYSR